MKVCRNKSETLLSKYNKIKESHCLLYKKVKKMGDMLSECSVISRRLKALLSSLSFLLANGMGGKARCLPWDKDSEMVRCKGEIELLKTGVLHSKHNIM